MTINHNQTQTALPLHLMTAMLPYLLSKTLKNASPDWSEQLPVSPPLTNLQEAVTSLQKDQLLAQAVENEAQKRILEFLSGVQAYQQTKFDRDIFPPETILTIGGAKLLDYGQTRPNAPIVFLVPSLINRYYILDLTEKLSFARYLRKNGARVFIVDWQAPTNAERHYNCAQYVTEILSPMAEFIRKNNRGEITIAGYCMGGLLAMALASIRPDLLDNLALFATPWDFASANFPRIALEENSINILTEYIDSNDGLSAEFVHNLFHYASPYSFQNKLREFSRMKKGSQEQLDFLAIENWVNDGVAMTREVAKDCLINWTQLNQPYKGEWRVGGQIINPEKLNLPCFVAVPRDDKIVPADSAMPLAKLIRNATIIEPRTGHIGMMTGSNRKSSLWQPFSEWLGQA